MGITVDISNITQSKAAIEENPTMQNPLDMRLPANAARIIHLGLNKYGSHVRNEWHLPILIKLVLRIVFHLGIDFRQESI